MLNKAMEQKLCSGEAVDVGIYPRTRDGDFILPPELAIDGYDLCDAATESWIWSVGRDSTGRVLASTTPKFYQNPGFECLWLR